jgi:hypothetical protein
MMVRRGIVLLRHAKAKALDENSIEEALNALMDKGFVFEPMLGTLKTT